MESWLEAGATVYLASAPDVYSKQNQCRTGVFIAFNNLMGYCQGEMDELLFEVTQETDGGYCAECLTESIFTAGDTWEQLRANVKEAVDAYYFDRCKPQHICLHLVRDEMLTSG